MVKSSTTSITPAQHADRHRVGGGDPVTGNVDIDNLFWTEDNTEVYTGSFSTAWTECDLSAIIGARVRLVHLEFTSDAGSIYVRTMGSIFTPKAESIGGGNTRRITVPTNSSGIFEYKANAALGSAKIWLRGYH